MAKHLKNILLFLAIFIIINSVINTFWGPEKDAPANNTGLVVQTTETEYAINNIVALNLENNTTDTIEFKNDCPEEPFTVIKYVDGEWQEKHASPEIECISDTTFKLQPGEKTTVVYDNWNFALFSDLGRYKIQVDTLRNGEEKAYESNEFSVTEQGFFSLFWIRLFYQPIYNVLMFLVSVMPGLNLGLAIILLTVIIRTILLIPSQKGLKSQKKIQDLQPKLDEIKKKYAGDQQKIAAETMAIWKTHKVNPLSSCLPMFIQLPFLIALFYVVQTGLNPDSAHYLYEPLKSFELHNISTYFLGLNLTKVNMYVLPLIVGGLQFLQMKLTAPGGKKQQKSKEAKNEMQSAMGMMTYIMPVMIAVFTATLPAAVGIYWGTSTLYGVLQQLVVNKSKTPTHPENSSDVKVKVLDKN